MRIGVNGILVNHLNQVLLIQRDDTGTWTIPGGGIDEGELPPEAVAREVREETGIISMPVRLVAFDYMPFNPEPFIILTFRCIQRGGEIQPSDETPQVGFVKVLELPRKMLAFHRDRLVSGLKHQGGAVHWLKHELSFTLKWRWALLKYFVYPFFALRRKWRKQPKYVPSPSWETSAFAIIRDEDGKVLWGKRRDVDAWNLPGGIGLSNEPPWETAVRETLEETGLHIKLTDLTGVYIYHNSSHMVFVFAAVVENGELTLSDETADFAYFPAGEEPANVVQQHLQRVLDADPTSEQPSFRFQEGPHLVLQER